MKITNKDVTVIIDDENEKATTDVAVIQYRGMEFSFFPCGSENTVGITVTKIGDDDEVGPFIDIFVDINRKGEQRVNWC